MPARYRLVQHRDLPGNDIGRCESPGCRSHDLNVLAAACDADVRCTAINSNGWMKNVVVSTNYGALFLVQEWLDSPCKGLLVRKGAPSTADGHSTDDDGAFSTRKMT